MAEVIPEVLADPLRWTFTGHPWQLQAIGQK
jgi:hypothetical protein